MKEIDKISIAYAGERFDMERIDAELKAIILTTEGTIPGSRGFGLAGEFYSRHPNEAVNILAMELEEKMAVYIPEITIASVENNSDNPAEGLNVTIHIEGRDGI